MRRALILIGVLTVGLVIALIARIAVLRASGRGLPGGTGVIEGVDVDVTSRIASRIDKVEVREGDSVKQGQVVVTLDCTDLDAALAQARAPLAAASAAAQASQATATSAGRSALAAASNITAAGSQLAVLKSQADLAKVDLDRTRKLVEAGALPKSELDAAQSKYDALENQIAAQRATETATRQQAGAATTSGAAAKAQAVVAQRNIDVAAAAVTRAEALVRECTLVAPRGGMVATRVHEPGEAVQPGTTILTITDLSEARTRFYLPNDELAAAAPGKKVQVRADPYPNQVFDGTIFYVSPKAEFTPRNVQTREDRERLVYAVEVRIPNADLKLREGMPVEVSIVP